MKPWFLALACLMVLGCGGEAGKEQAGTGPDEQRKAQIRRFWELYNRATDLRLKGEWEAAAGQYQEALAVDGKHEDALYYLGNAFFELGRFQEAATTWKRLVETSPNQSSRAHAQLGMLYSCGAPGSPFDLALAERELQQALAINKEESGPVIKLGEVALLRGERDQALAYLSAGRNLNFKSVQANYLIGYLKWAKGDAAGALKELKQAADFALAAKPPPEASGEGDTKKKGPLLARGVSSRGLLAAHWAALEDWPKDAVNPDRVQEEYGRFDRRLQEVERRFGLGGTGR